MEKKGILGVKDLHRSLLITAKKVGFTRIHSNSKTYCGGQGGMETRTKGRPYTNTKTSGHYQAYA